MSEQRIKKPWRYVFIAAGTLFSIITLLLGVSSFLLSTQSGSRWVLDSLANQLNADSGSTFSFRETQGTLFRGLTFRDIRFSNTSLDVTIEQLSTSWNPYSLLSSNFLLSTLEIEGIAATLLSSDEPSLANSDDAALSFSNPLPIGLTINNITTDRIEINQGDEVFQLEQLAMSIELEGEKLQLIDLQVTASNMTAEGDIELSLTENLPLQANLSWHYEEAIFDLYDDLQGELELSGDLQSIQIAHQLTSPYSILSTGQLSPNVNNDAPSLNLTHSAASIVASFNSLGPIELKNVVFRTSGSLSEIDLELQTLIENELLPDISADIAALYDGSNLAIRRYSLATSDGSVSGQAQLEIVDGVEASGNFVIMDQNPLVYMNQPLSIELIDVSGEGSFSARLQGSDIRASLTLEQLSAQLENHPTSASGFIDYDNGDVELRQLRMSTANNQLSLEGTYSDALNVSWQIDAPMLQELLADLSGGLTASGSLQGNPSRPDLVGQLTVSDLSYGSVELQNLTASIEQIDGQVNGVLNAINLAYTDDSSSFKLPSMEWDIAGTQEAHQIAGSINSDFGNVDLTLLGGIADLSDLLWQASLTQGSASTIMGDWRSQTPAALTLSGDSFNLSNNCWLQGETVLCFALERDASQTSILTATLEDYPLVVFNADNTSISDLSAAVFEFPQLPQRTLLEGQLDGELSALFPPNSEANVEVALRSKNGIFSILPPQDNELTDLNEGELAEPQIYNLQTNELSASFIGGRWDISSGTFFLRENIEDSNLGVSGEISTALSIDQEQSLSGSIDASLDDIRWVEAFLPELTNVSGSLNAESRIAGTIDAPEVTGTAQIANASLTIERLGISLSNITTQLSSSNTGTLQFQGAAESGSGSVELDGTVTDLFSTTRALSAQLSGNDFELANIPDVKLSVSPDISLNLNSEQVQINGELQLPILELTLQELPESAIDVSRDVVINHYPLDRPDLARSLYASETSLFNRPITGEVDISLGEQVSFSGFGMSTRVGGDLNIRQTIGGSNLTYGELNILDGSYKMYGQTLDIRQGKFLFFGAYDNPAVDIRAVREVDNLTVGVLMNGTLKNINSQLYSTPALPDNDIVAVLVTGRPFSSIGAGDGDALLGSIAKLGIKRSQGLTNQIRDKLGLDALAVESEGDINNSVLTIGKYITPEIFVRYGVGLFDSQPKVSVDYSISDRIKLQAESGEFQSVDITYTVEQ